MHLAQSTVHIAGFLVVDEKVRCIHKTIGAPGRCDHRGLLRIMLTPRLTLSCIHTSVSRGVYMTHNKPQWCDIIQHRGFYNHVRQILSTPQCVCAGGEGVVTKYNSPLPSSPTMTIRNEFPPRYDFLLAEQPITKSHGPVGL